VQTIIPRANTRQTRCLGIAITPREFAPVCAVLRYEIAETCAQFLPSPFSTILNLSVPDFNQKKRLSTPSHLGPMFPAGFWGAACEGS
ncbi:MAG: hypothetical protein ACE5JA_01605, partial [bacterium]